MSPSAGMRTKILPTNIIIFAITLHQRTSVACSSVITRYFPCLAFLLAVLYFPLTCACSPTGMLFLTCTFSHLCHLPAITTPPHSFPPRASGLSTNPHPCSSPITTYYRKGHFVSFPTTAPDARHKSWNLRQDPLDLSFWSFFTFLHHGIDEVERHLLWKFHKKIQRKSWSNVSPKLLTCIRFLYKVVHKNGRLRKSSIALARLNLTFLSLGLSLWNLAHLIKRARFLATESVNSLWISAPQWWPFEKRETGSVNFWQGKV